MTELDGCRLSVVLYDGPGCAPMDVDDRFDALGALLDAGYHVTRADNGVAPGIADATAVAVLGRFDECPCRREALREAGVPLRYIDTSGLDASGMVAQVDRFRQELGLPSPGAWVPWFPVIDYDRCTNCKQCLSFCLFGVYGVSADGRVEVRNPDRCKTGCPACARVCPTVAIMFPKYDKAPVNGDVVRDEDLQREAVKVDLSDLVAGDVHSSLRARSRKRGGRFRTPRVPSGATSDDQRRLEQVRTELDIPAEVWSSLSPACACGKGGADVNAEQAERGARAETDKDGQTRRPVPEQDT